MMLRKNLKVVLNLIMIKTKMYVSTLYKVKATNRFSLF